MMLMRWAKHGEVVMTLIVAVIAYGLTAKLQSAYFSRLNRTGATATFLVDSWLEHSAPLCLARCLIKSPPCNLVSYNRQSKRCAPVYMTPNRPVASALLDEMDVVYSSNACNADLGFQPFVFEGNVFCLFISNNSVKFETAHRTCATKNSQMYTALTAMKVDLLNYLAEKVIKNSTWIGLTDFAIEGVYTWVTGQRLYLNNNPLNWHPGQPDNFSNEDCCMIGEWPGTHKYEVNDCSCSGLCYFICEMSDN